MKRRVITMAAGVASLVLSGCASTEFASEVVPESSSAEVVSAPALASGTHKPGDAWFANLVVGDLVLTDQKCFGLRSPDGTIRPVVFQEGATVLGDGGGVSLPGVGDVAIGDYLTGSGWTTVASAADATEIPAGCAADEVWMLMITVV